MKQGSGLFDEVRSVGIVWVLTHSWVYVERFHNVLGVFDVGGGLGMATLCGAVDQTTRSRWGRQFLSQSASVIFYRGK